MSLCTPLPPKRQQRRTCTSTRSRMVHVPPLLQKGRDGPHSPSGFIPESGRLQDFQSRVVSHHKLFDAGAESERVGAYFLEPGVPVNEDVFQSPETDENISVNRRLSRHILQQTQRGARRETPRSSQTDLDTGIMAPCAHAQIRT